jgi:transposase
MARPTKFKPEFCDQMVQAGKQGLSVEAFAGQIGVSKECIYHWTRTKPAFSDAKKRFETASQLFWETAGLAGMTGKIKNFNAAVWIFNMKNRFKWRDLVQMTDEDAPDNNTYETDWGATPAPIEPKKK